MVGQSQQVTFILGELPVGFPSGRPNLPLGSRPHALHGAHGPKLSNGHKGTPTDLGLGSGLDMLDDGPARAQSRTGAP